MREIIDHHVHTNFSPDSNTTMEAMVKRGIELGLKGITFTDHVDFDSPDEDFLYEIDYDKYMIEIENLKSKYPQIEIQMGVEVGYQPHLNDRLDGFIKSYPFDFVICSMHVCEGLDLYNGDYFKGKNQFESNRIYLESIRNSILSYNNFDIYGHLDMIVRYGNFDKKFLEITEYQEIIDEILNLIIKKGKGIEVNTSGYRYSLNYPHPNTDILKRYYELGGEIITLGSDAHKTQDLSLDFHTAKKILKDIGFTKISQFKNRKSNFTNI